MHAALAAVLLSVPGLGDAAREQAAASAVRRVNAQLAETEARRLQHRVEHMAQIRRLLDEAAGRAPTPDEDSVDSSPAALAARAERLAAAIEVAEQQLRAAALAKMTGMPLAQAMREIEARAETDRVKTPAAATPAHAIEQLEKRAKEALEAQRAQLAARAAGVKVAYEGTGQQRPADGIPRSLAVQLAAEFRNGPAQGRVGEEGFEGGRSINPKWVQGTKGGVDARDGDPRRRGRLVDGLLAAPVNVQGDSLDLTVANGDGTGEKARPTRIDMAQVRTAAGRVFGSGGAYANRVYLDSWYVIGPFAPAAGDEPIAAVHPPEEGVDLDASYRARDGRLLHWEYASRGFYPFIPPGREERAIYYAYTELQIADEAEEGRDVWLTLAADDDSMLWLDDRLVWKSERGPKAWYQPPYYLPDEQVASLALAEGHRRVHLRPGAHRLLLKLFNDRDRAFFSVVVVP